MSTARACTRHLVTTSAAVVVFLSATLTACGSSDDPDKGTTSSSSPSDVQSSTSADPYAGWHTASDDGGQFLVPPDWDVEEGPRGPDLLAPAQREGGVRVGGGIFGTSPTIDSAEAIDNAAEAARKFLHSGGMKVERVPDETFGGVTFYHIRGENSAEWYDDYGTVHDSKLITVRWTFIRGMVDRKQADEMIDQVMQTFKPAS